uniref:Uncharacterized protein n=1 Tax=Molossus molossus TaxID=27622 RepID=A0A7J8EER4_MOLMO|nr:hypothetical protein HJG59_008911 [Molossus molossus]
MEKQVVSEDPHSVISSERQVSHIMEGQSRPEVSVATWGPGDPVPMDGQSGIPSPKPPWLHRPQPIRKLPMLHRPPTPKQPRLDRQLKIFNYNLEHGVDVKCTRADDLEPKEAEPKGPTQETEQTPALRPAVHPEGPDAGADLEGCPLPQVVPPPAAALEPGRPGQPLLTWLRRPHPWLKSPPPKLPWFLPQRRSCLRTIHQGQLQSCLLKGLNLTHQKNLLHPRSLTFFFIFHLSYVFIFPLVEFNFLFFYFYYVGVWGGSCFYHFLFYVLSLSFSLV